jgi:hypothetical protein
MFDPPSFALFSPTLAFDAPTFFAGLPTVQHRHSIVIARSALLSIPERRLAQFCRAEWTYLKGANDA